MVRFPFLHSLFDSDWFIGPNFDNWYWKLQLVLEHEWILNMIMDPAPKVSMSNICDAIKETYQKWPYDQITMWFFESSEKHEFSCKFNDTQWEKILQILKEFFHIFEDVSSVG